MGKYHLPRHTLDCINIFRAGKSTLLSLLAGSSKITRGSITFNWQMKNPFGLVPQKNVLLDELTCEQTLKLFYDLKSRKTSRQERARDIRQLLEDVELLSKRSSKASELSGGMKRRLQLAIGMTGNSECAYFHFHLYLC
jgi:ATP-binding cassette subfamily A (ABC1) protein 3